MDDDGKKFFKRRNPFFDLFGDFSKMDDMFNEQFERIFKELEKGGGKPLTYGVSIKVGPDGKPIVQEFGDMQPTRKEIQVKDAREPLVDVIEHNSEIDVLAELPGVEKKNIELDASDGTLTINVPKKFFKEVELPVNVKEDDIKAHYKNGVLTVRLKKKKSSKPKKTKIKVE